MAKVEITYNPYIVKTEVSIDGKSIESGTSRLTYVTDKRLQEWIEPRETIAWSGIYKELRSSTGDSELELEFIGTFGDFEDLVYAKEKFGGCFDKITLTHKNEKTAKDADPYQKIEKLKELYQELQNGPVDEFKTEDIKENFKRAINSEFRITVIAPMSSGKSTLINAIVGRDLLPAVNQATTAVITEIKDNDKLDNFVVSAVDRHGNTVVHGERATKKLISEMNYKKDPDDPEGKAAFISLVQLEGPIPNLPSDALNTVFVDTPGGNNSQNQEHEEIMDRAINDENKNLILYVFNGAQLGTNDSNIILQKIANAMKNSRNGKLSKDRFLFVANRMDEFDVDKEPYDEVIKNTIFKQLEANGITEPNLFLASAQTARLIRMMNNGEELTENEEDDLDTFVKKFNRPKRVLSRYASINSVDKERLVNEALECTEKAKESDSGKEVNQNRYRAAELNSGIPAIEVAIREYLEKYALAIKIKTVHDTFMTKVNERKMFDSLEKELAESEDKYKAVKAELQEKMEKRDKDVWLKEFERKVDEISLDVTPIDEQRAMITKKLDDLVKNTEDKIPESEAEYKLNELKREFESIGKSAKVALDNALKNGVRKSCERIVSEYEEYITALEKEGILRVGDLDIKKMGEFKESSISEIDDLLYTGEYETSERVRVGSHMEKKSGFWNGLGRIFLGWAGVGYEEVDDYENRKYIKLGELVRSAVRKIVLQFNKEVKAMVKDTEYEVKGVKKDAKKKLKKLDGIIAKLIKEINEKIDDRDELQARVERNKEKTEWIKNFVQQVDDLLEI